MSNVIQAVNTLIATENELNASGKHEFDKIVTKLGIFLKTKSVNVTPQKEELARAFWKTSTKKAWPYEQVPLILTKKGSLVLMVGSPNDKSDYTFRGNSANAILSDIKKQLTKVLSDLDDDYSYKKLR